MKNIAVMGFGTVGSGVVEIIEGTSFKEKVGQDISVKAILDVREFPDSPYSSLITNDFNKIIEDDDIDIVVETIGGINPAYEFTVRSLKAGKSVVTSNKELVAAKGAQIMQIARENNASYLFEASVGGGIPIIRPLNNCLAANEIYEIMGILNGTTNYILTQMIKNGQSFESALSDAQKKGYAERDPSADIEGFDTCRKIAILSALSYGKQIDSDKIPTQGITKVALKDIEYADKAGYVIKLIGKSKKVNGKVYAKVCPLMLSKNHPLSGVEDVFNAILVKASATGEVMFYGKGAGKMPTASAVVADCLDIIKHNGFGAPHWQEGGELTCCNPDKVKYYIRLNFTDNHRAEKCVIAVFDKVSWIDTDSRDAAFITFAAKEDEIQECIDKLGSLIGKENIVSKIQVEID